LAAVDVLRRAAGLEPLEPLEDARARELYERHADRVLAYCRSRLRRREDAEDAVQTTFLHAVRALRRGESPSHELAWLLGIARNVCLARIESAGRRGRLELVCDPVDLEASEAATGRRDELIGLEQALARLPERQRRAVLLRDWRGLSYEEVAAQLGVSLANAETLIFRGRRTLAALLEEEPAAARRRLASLGNAASLLAWAKAPFGGAAAASKLASAVALVAVSGAGVAVGTDVLDRPSPPRVVRASPPAAAAAAPASARPSPEPSRARERAPRDTVSQAASAPSAAAPRAETPAETPNPGAATAAAAAGRARDTVSQGSLERPAPTPSPAPRPATAAPAPAPATPRTTGAVPALPTEDVGPAVEGAAETVEAAAPPATETVVEAVESLPVPPLPTEIPLPVDPPALLP
jgi:RNA polymerase sigma factor (sigma-70 family)